MWKLQMKKPFKQRKSKIYAYEKLNKDTVVFLKLVKKDSAQWMRKKLLPALSELSLSLHQPLLLNMSLNMCKF